MVNRFLFINRADLSETDHINQIYFLGIALKSYQSRLGKSGEVTALQLLFRVSPLHMFN